MTLMFLGIKVLVGAINIGEAFAISEPDWLPPEKQASSITVMDFAGSFDKLEYSVDN